MDKKQDFLRLLKDTLMTQFGLSASDAAAAIQNSRIKERIESRRVWSVVEHYNVEHWAQYVIKKFVERSGGEPSLSEDGKKNDTAFRTVGTSFKGIGIDITRSPWRVRANDECDEIYTLDDIPGPFTIFSDGCRLIFGIEPRFPWEDDGIGAPAFPQTWQEAVRMISEQLADALRDEDWNSPPASEVALHIENLEIALGDD